MIKVSSHYIAAKIQNEMFVLNINATVKRFCAVHFPE